MTYYTTTSAVWDGWTSTSATTTTSAVWGSWTMASGTSASTTSATDVWIRWTDGTSSGQYQGDYVYAQPIASAYNKETAEQKAERLEREKIAAEKRVAEQKKLAEEAQAREQKAWQFLVAVLTAQQKEELEKKAYFELTSVKSGKRYRIHKGQTRNIRGLHDGKAIETLCFHPKEQVHDYDAMAIQKLALECDEEGARQIANISYH